jgi:hypothetical protein
MGISLGTADHRRGFARAWLRREARGDWAAEEI